MKLAVMQPYFVPYIGYWQLMNAADCFVVYDDVNYINQGWIHRNRILMNGRIIYYNLPIASASSNRLIMEHSVALEDKFRTKSLRTLEMAYRRSPAFPEVFPLMEDILRCQETDLTAFLIHSFSVINSYLGIDTELKLSSQIPKDPSLRGQDKVLSLCQALSAADYINPIGGTRLYSRSLFREHGVDLHFVKTRDLSYPQRASEFIPNLSIVDVMMNNPVQDVRRLLEEYDLVSGVPETEEGTICDLSI